jgi:dihydroorotase
MVIKNAQIIDKNQNRIADIEVVDGYISKIGNNLNSEFMIDANGLIALPNIIDLNYTLKDFKTIQESQVGGRGRICATFLPQITTIKELNYIQQELQKQNIKIHIVTNGIFENKLLEQASLYKEGVSFFEVDSDINSNLLRRTFEYAKLKDKTLFIKCKNSDIEDDGVIFDAETSAILGLPSIVPLSQSAEIAKVCEYANYSNINILIRTIYTKNSINILKKLKQDNIFTEVGINHLILDDSSCMEFNTMAKEYPPLADKQTKQELISALKDGTIDVISSNHISQTLNSKDMPFQIASFGIDTNSYFLSLIYTHLVKEGLFSFSEISKFISYNPAKILKLKDEGLIKEGYRASFLLFNPNKTITIQEVNSPYNQLFGEVTKIF